MITNKVGVKRFLVYKSHVFPEVRKPIRSITDYFMYMNPNLDTMQTKKMAQLMDEQQKRKTKSQKDFLNEKINLELRKYYQKYIQPFESCPQYYSMLFQYAKIKMEYLKNKNQINPNIDNQQEQPFYLPKKEIQLLTRQFKNESKNTVFDNLENEKKIVSIKVNDFGRWQNNLSNHQHTQEKQQQQNSTLQKKQQEKVFSIEQQKLLYKIFKQLYPSEKLMVLNKFNQFYKEFIFNSESIAKFLLEETIFFIKPFIYTSPLQLYQAKHHQKRMNECLRQFLTNVQVRDKFNVEFVKLLVERKKDSDYIQQKYNVTAHKMHTEYRKQYYNIDKFNSFYSMLKT